MSSVIYNSKYEAEYIGRTIQKLESRIEQHTPAKILHGRCYNLHVLVNLSGPAIAEHLINNQVCAKLFIRDLIL